MNKDNINVFVMIIVDIVQVKCTVVIFLFICGSTVSFCFFVFSYVILYTKNICFQRIKKNRCIQERARFFCFLSNLLHDVDIQ